MEIVKGETKMAQGVILVTGATGYVGGRLVPALLKAGYRVRAMARSLDKAACRPWAEHPRVELVEGDVLAPASLGKAVFGCTSAFYLVHSMIAQKEKFVEADRRAAQNMVAAAADADLHRIIYLGGLAEASGGALSKHLASRNEVADILKAGSVPTTDLRAPMILGSGSASFEILRYLVERLPIMTTPRWVQSRNQPIAIRNVISYLVGCLEHPETTGNTYDIGGPEILTYRDLLDTYAEEAGLAKRIIIPVPVMTPTLSALWIHLVSPVPKAIALPLTQGLTSEAVCTENRIETIIPQQLLSCREAIRLALQGTGRGQAATSWMDAGRLPAPEWIDCGDADWAGGTILRHGYRVLLGASAQEVWQPIRRIGGQSGWYFGDVLWRMRGMVDRLSGGMGYRRGRRHSTEIRVGDALDFWRVIGVDPPRKLTLAAEMKLPGEAVLEFRINEYEKDRTELIMLSSFMPRGLAGILYWHALVPFDRWIFSGMFKGILRRVGKPILEGPERYTPQNREACEQR